MRWSLEEVVAATGGRSLSVDDGTVVIDHVTQHSSESRPGTLFVPIVGKRDGHDFIPDAVRAGASAYFIARTATTTTDSQLLGGAVAIEVEDTQRALTDMAIAARNRLGSVPVVGVTGSVGKTTTKDLLAAVLGRNRRVHVSNRSFNNEIGVPLTLLAAPDDVEVVVVELGSRGAGHIRSLCDIARPTMGVVTTVGLAHTNQFGSLDGVVAAKRELVECLPSASKGGVVFLNANVVEVEAMSAHTTARVVTYGSAVDADIMARDLSINNDLVPRFTLVSRIDETDSPNSIGTTDAVSTETADAVSTGTADAVSTLSNSVETADAARTVTADKVEVVLGTRGIHTVNNALAAAAVGLVLQVSLEDVAMGLSEPVLSPLRMELIRTPIGARIINDSYNANPLSMQAALRSLAVLPCSRRLAVLGVMAELGGYSESEHAAIAALARDLGIQVIAVDAPHYASRCRGSADRSSADTRQSSRRSPRTGAVDNVGTAVNNKVGPGSAGSGVGSLIEVSDIDEAQAALNQLGGLNSATAVLIKGSRVAGLERLVDRLVECSLRAISSDG